ncbi:hypothetical protein C9427_24415 [Mesorhizobium helmanticense]|uniref:Uncharacterized protein n=1 Tax=Mesorhizobium helmanticense TaxID=1776423 RepID=A0A2T4IQ88_9HYPH|nr:hypothetical protein C9427_24415 [Mesorhizobium helmanticense]
MSRKSVQRFCGNDMHKNKNPKRVAWGRSNATRFRLGSFVLLPAEFIRAAFARFSAMPDPSRPKHGRGWHM